MKSKLYLPWSYIPHQTLDLMLFAWGSLVTGLYLCVQLENKRKSLLTKIRYAHEQGKKTSKTTLTQPLTRTPRFKGQFSRLDQGGKAINFPLAEQFAAEGDPRNFSSDVSVGPPV